jgi:CheY-like chemotaxis protein
MRKLTKQDPPRHKLFTLRTKCLRLDVRMPGMSGLDLQRNLVTADSRIPIVFITSHADGEARSPSTGSRHGGIFVQAMPARNASQGDKFRS